MRVCWCLGWTLGAVLYENSHLQHDCQRAAAAVEHDDDDNNDNYDIRVVLSRLLTVGNDKNIAWNHLSMNKNRTTR